MTADQNVTYAFSVTPTGSTVGGQYITIPMHESQTVPLVYTSSVLDAVSCAADGANAQYVCPTGTWVSGSATTVYVMFTPNSSQVGPVPLQFTYGADYFRQAISTDVLPVYGTFYTASATTYHDAIGNYFSGSNVTIVYNVITSGPSIGGEQVLLEAARVDPSGPVQWSAAGASGACELSTNWYVCNLTVPFVGPSGLAVSILFYPLTTEFGPVNPNFGFRALYFEELDLQSSLYAQGWLNAWLSYIDPMIDFVGTEVMVDLYVEATANSSFGGDYLQMVERFLEGSMGVGGCGGMRSFFEGSRVREGENVRQGGRG